MEINPNKIASLYGRGFVKSKLGDHRGAIEDFTKATDAGNLENIKLVYSGKISKIQLDELRNGILDKTKMTEFTTEKSEVYFNRGIAKAKSGDPKQAIEDFNKAISLNPVYAEAFFMRAISKSNLGDQRSALQDCNNSIFLQAKYAEAYFLRGILKIALSDNSGCNDLSKSGELGYSGAYNVIKEVCN